MLGLTSLVHEEYNTIIFRIGLYKESLLKAQLKAAEESFNVDAARVLSAQITTLGLDQSIQAPIEEELTQEIDSFISRHKGPLFKHWFSLKDFDAAERCKVLFEGLLRELPNAKPSQAAVVGFCRGGMSDGCIVDGGSSVHFIVVGCVIAVIACLLYAIMRAKKL